MVIFLIILFSCSAKFVDSSLLRVIYTLYATFSLSQMIDRRPCTAWNYIVNCCGTAAEDCRGLIISRLCGHLFHFTRLKPLSSSICFLASKIIRHPAPYGYGELHDGLLQRTASPCCFFTVSISRYGIGDIINMAMWQRRSAAWSNRSGCCNDSGCKLWALAPNISHPCNRLYLDVALQQKRRNLSSVRSH